MAVYRVNKTRGYTVMANFHLRDKNLSLKAVGILSKMLSFNDGWKFSTRGLAAICKEGPDAILTALRELEKTAISSVIRNGMQTAEWAVWSSRFMKSRRRFYRTRKNRIRKISIR